jgi:hypothetical protein
MHRLLMLVRMTVELVLRKIDNALAMTPSLCHDKKTFAFFIRISCEANDLSHRDIDVVLRRYL